MEQVQKLRFDFTSPTLLNLGSGVTLEGCHLDQLLWYCPDDMRISEKKQQQQEWEQLNHHLGGRLYLRSLRL